MISTVGLYSGVIMLELFWLALVLLHGSFTPVSTVLVKREVVSGSSEKAEIVLKEYQYHKNNLLLHSFRGMGTGIASYILVSHVYTALVLLVFVVT